MSYNVKKKSLLSCLAALIGCLFIRAYIWTLRVTTHHKAEAMSSIKNRSSGSILVLWHDSILLMPILHELSCIKHTCILISNSQDGNIPAAIAERFANVEVIRVRHTARQTALKNGISAILCNHNLVVTPDGPRGPRHAIKDGCIFAAKATQAPILPIVWAASKQISLKSWDRLRIPLPFSKVHISYLPDIFPHLAQTDSDVKNMIKIQMEREEARLLQLVSL